MTDDQIEKLTEQMNDIPYFAVSAKNGSGVEEALEDLVRHILSRKIEEDVFVAKNQGVKLASSRLRPQQVNSRCC